MKTIHCRAHGGTFQIEPRRGRPPTSCSPENPCSGNQATPAQLSTQQARRKLAELTGGPVMPAHKLVESGYSSEAVRKAAKVDLPVSRAQNTALPLALAAKERLEALGWTCAGKAFTMDPNETYTFGTHSYSGTTSPVATLSCTRGEEILTMVFVDRGCVEQKYSAWSTDERPAVAANGRPARRLDFDPDEMPDAELVRRISGMKITWWNKLASNESSATVDGGKVRIDHSYNGKGDENPDDRMITFTGQTSGFHSLRVGALLQIG